MCSKCRRYLVFCDMFATSLSCLLPYSRESGNMVSLSDTVMAQSTDIQSTALELWLVNFQKKNHYGDQGRTLTVSFFCLHQDHKAESSKSPSVLGPYLENNYSKLYSKTSSLLGRRDCKPVHPPTDTYVKSYCLKGRI